ncbi:MAG: hypothetical protein Q8R70_11085 [Methanoregula sp.]|nr:hypothetical protein [Methanoregula sp.]
MNSAQPDELENLGFRSMLIPTIAILGEILANGYIIWFLLISIPSGCTRLATESAGRQSCGIETGAYIIAGISAILILIGVYYLAKWNFPQQK